MNAVKWRNPLAMRHSRFLYKVVIKMDVLQSVSVVAMVAGLLLSALGAFGTYYFGGKAEIERRQAAVPPVRVGHPKPAARDTVRDQWLASIVEPVAIATANPPPLETPLQSQPLLNASDTTLLPVAEMPIVELPVEKPSAKVTLPTPPPIALEPLPSHHAIATPAEPAAEPPSTASFSDLGLAPWQLEKLLQRLRTFDHGTITIHSHEGNDDTWRFAAALKEAFIAGGWRVIGVKAVKSARAPDGLTLSSGTFPPPTEITTIFTAFVTAGIKLGTDLDPAQGKQHAVLYVGSRP